MVPAVISSSPVPATQVDQAPAPANQAPHRPPRNRRTGWVTLSVVLLVTVLVERWFLSLHALPGDMWSARVGMSHKPWVIFAITRVYQQIGRPLVAIGETLAMIAWLWRFADRRAIRGLAIVLIASACNGLIKIFCGPTPLWQTLPHHVGTNFPSGVVTFCTASGGYMVMVAWRQGRRRGAAIMGVLLALSGPARILGAQHLFSDVLGAYMLGSAFLILATLYLTHPAARPQEVTEWNIASLEAPA